MKTMKLILIIMLGWMTFSCDRKDKSETLGKESKTIRQEETKGENPKISVKVNKQYDKKGNLIKFDSTYTYLYSSKGKDSLRTGVDSVFKRFKVFYNTRINADMNKQMSELFMNDTLFKYDFLNADYFSKRFELNLKRMEYFFRQMDSMKIGFINEPIRTEKQKTKFKNNKI